MINMRTILCPTDFSETSKYAFEYALQFAEEFAAKLEIIHVQVDESQVIALYMPEVTLQNVNKEIEEAAKQQLDDFLAPYSERLSKVRYEAKLIKGTPYIKIIDAARDYDADMVVIGTHGRTGVEHALFGSTAEKVVRKSPCPVFTVSLKNKK